MPTVVVISIPRVHQGSIDKALIEWAEGGGGLQAWRDVAWYDADECLRPLARLADNAMNRAALVRLGLVAVLSEFLAAALAAAVSPKPFDVSMPWLSGANHSDPEGWTALADSDGRAGSVSRLPDNDVDWAWDLPAWGQEGTGGGQLSSRSTNELGLAVEALAGLARDPHGRQRMCQARLPSLLRAVASATQRSSCCLSMARCGEEGHRREGWLLRERHLAVAMGQVCCAARRCSMRAPL